MTKIIKMTVDVVDTAQVIKKISEYVRLRTVGQYICVSNVHMCMETFDSREFREVVNGADLVIPDGRPIYWAQKLLGHKEAQQVRGQDITNSLCELSNTSDLKIGLYGGSSDEVLDKVIEVLKKSYPSISITYSFSPPFRALSEEEDKNIIDDINNAEVDVLFVGIGCPKQERWMAQHKDSLSCVMLGVGAAFDFISGSKKHAPRWMQKAGLEWAFRLASEPKRLWKRYLKQNPRFIYHFSIQLFKARLFNKPNPVNSNES
ncbi:WecB/TagA/CpsF family glycosyltransferase [Vibrio hannami]|uniref:WecB/TagA/CpsF family glycosyltransferase n=1 Tax=Vibrio hannami TaxID=2717094 RepID=UPI00240EF2D4|nr:WecB/TagA/CpsF family glycosyltransferase [Vibrio hannami]MDG3088252.1 WecB/TagA/CpsF family glycosyltransferase [Vibrio hannami]